MITFKRNLRKWNKNVIARLDRGVWDSYTMYSAACTLKYTIVLILCLNKVVVSEFAAGPFPCPLGSSLSWIIVSCDFCLLSCCLFYLHVEVKYNFIVTFLHFNVLQYFTSTGGGSLKYFLIFWNFIFSYLVLRVEWILLFIIYFPPLKWLWFNLVTVLAVLVVKSYSTSVVPGFSRKEFNS